MGFLDSVLGIIGFGIGIPIGLLIGFLVFIYSQPRNIKDPVVEKPVDTFGPSLLVDLLPQLPLWVMNPDYEKVDWLNKFIQGMWPSIDKAACGIIKTTAEPIFAEYIGSFQITSMGFDRVSLGTLPPKIHGLKAHDSNENELVLDLVVRWAGNPDIVLSIKIMSIQLTIQLVDLQVSAAIRIFLRPFVPTFPCFSRIEASLMEKPNIDFGLKVLGGDIMAIPGLYQCVQEVISRQVAKLYLWPQKYELNILDSSIGATKKPVGILHVKIVRAKKLLNKDFLGKSDPYVKLSLTGERLPAKKTSVIMNDLNPIWLEDFKLTVKDPETQVLQLQLYDWEKVGAHDYLGMQVVSLNELAPYEKKELSLDLIHSTDPNDRHNKLPRGQITFELTFVPFQEDSKKYSGSFRFGGDGSSRDGHDATYLTGSGLLLVTIIRAEDVEGKSHNNPYVRILFKGEARKTKSIKKTRDPFWNEEFQFVLEEAPIHDIIRIEVISKKRRIGFRSKESLGYVEINLGDVVYNGHINEKFNLINSRDGIIHLDLRWKVI